MRVPLLAATLVLAGCIGAPDAAPDLRAPTPTDPAAPVAVADLESGTSANATSFVWRSSAAYGDLALSMRVASVEEETSCDLYAAMARSAAPAGLGFLRFTVRDGGLGSMGGGGGGAIVGAHVEETHLLEALGSDGSGATGVGSAGTIDRDGLELVLAGVSTAPYESDITEGGSVLVNVTCEGPVVVSDFAYSREVALFRAGYGSTGAGASIAFAASAGAQEMAQLDATTPRVVAVLAGSLTAGQLRIASPEGETTAATHPLDPARLFVDGGPGAWAAGIDVAAGTFPAIGGIVGLTPIGSWDEITASSDAAST